MLQSYFILQSIAKFLNKTKTKVTYVHTTHSVQMHKLLYYPDYATHEFPFQQFLND
jgi:hypothetical protein